MNKLSSSFFLLIAICISFSCQKDNNQAANEIWIYTSLYKDTIADLTPQLEAAFPAVKFRWYQAGSEDIATKVGAELMIGESKADILISSDRFWYEDLAKRNMLHQYASVNAQDVPATFKNPDGHYSTLSIPVMVLAYNQDIIKQNPPMTFKELTDPRWKNLVSSGSPLASGTNFTTMAFLQKSYGWEYFSKLKSNGMIAEGGNSAVIRRLQSGERPVGKVLLENILRFQHTDKRLKFVLPKDGAIIHNNVIAITKKKKDRRLAEKVVDWMYEKKGQEAMVRSFMYSPLEKYAAPIGAPTLKEILSSSRPWSPELIKEIGEDRANLKEKFTEIMFQ